MSILAKFLNPDKPASEPAQMLQQSVAAVAIAKHLQQLTQLPLDWCRRSAQQAIRYENTLARRAAGMAGAKAMAFADRADWDTLTPSSKWTYIRLAEEAITAHHRHLVEGHSATDSTLCEERREIAATSLTLGEKVAQFKKVVS